MPHFAITPVQNPNRYFTLTMSLAPNFNARPNPNLLVLSCLNEWLWLVNEETANI